MQPEGGTLLYDATYSGIETLVAARREGKNAVVVLTDGKDESPGSRYSDQLVIDRAKEEKVPLYMLGLGQHDEINETVMKRMAEETGGKYFHAGSEQRLFEIFEKLSIDLHDDGINEQELRELAEKTGGKFFWARDASKLPKFFEELAAELQSTYTVTFPSRRSSHDGTARGIDISVERDGVRMSNVGSADYNVHGVVVPEMDYRIYLVLLALLSVFLLAPVGVRRLYRFYGGNVMHTRDTITALSTAPGPGGRAHCAHQRPRLDRRGLCTVRTAATSRRRPTLPCCRDICVCRISLPLPADVYFWAGPHSYTGQDLAEIHTLSCPPLAGTADRAAAPGAAAGPRSPASSRCARSWPASSI